MDVIRSASTKLTCRRCGKDIRVGHYPLEPVILPDGSYNSYCGPCAKKIKAERRDETLKKMRSASPYSFALRPAALNSITNEDLVREVIARHRADPGTMETVLRAMGFILIENGDDGK